MDERSRHRQFEDQFHRQLQARAETLIRGSFPANQLVCDSMPDGLDAVRATLGRLERYDRGLLDQLPGTRAAQLRFRRRFFGGLLSRGVARVRAQVLVPLEALLEDRPPGPVGREQVLDALARYELLPRRERPTAVIFASAAGFTSEAKGLVSDHASPVLILMGGREDGGWDAEIPAGLRRSPWARLLEFETEDDRLRRLLYHLEQQASLLDSRGVSIPQLAAQLGLSAEQTEQLVRQACRLNSRLMTVVHDGRTHVCRSPLAGVSGTMSIWSRIRRLLRLKPTRAEQVRLMTAQRTALEQQRLELDQRVGALEAEERAALAQGGAARSDAERKQVAGRLMRVRRDLRRARAHAQVFTQQIDILGTHIHNLTLAEQGQRVALPRAEDLTREAAEAEQIVSELAANADLAAGVEVAAQTPMQEEEEAAIMEEFAQIAQARAAEKQSEAEPATEPGEPLAEPGQPARPPAAKDKDAARPEPG